MDNSAFNALFSWQFLLFSLSMFVVTWVIRTISEYFFSVSSKMLWEKLLLPLMPIVLGVLVAGIAKKYPYPDGLNSLSARLMFGCVAGMLSGLVYQVVKGVLKSKIAADVPNETDPTIGNKQP